MIADISTIIWKEWHELLAWRGGFGGGSVGLLLFVGIVGVFMPLQSGRDPVALLFWAWMPLISVASVVLDSFAGERERHTLETLLGSRLSDQAILLGKVAAAVGYGWAASLSLLLLGLVTINVAYGRGEVLIYSPLLGLSIVALTFLASLLIASAGVIFSLRASTVRQAAQTFMVASAVLLLVPLLGFQLLPDDVKLSLAQTLTGAATPTGLILGALPVLAVLDVGLLLIARARFARAQLVLS